MTLLLHIFLNILLIGLFLFSKLLPYKDRLNPQYKGVFNFFSSIFTPLLNGLKTIFKPFMIGFNLSLDLTQLVLFILLLLLMQIF
ncbi:MAG: hypothetical protein JWP81_4101 [Ferruginibacter sp.]|nr:hypothetical protein [Ferruginibacter sp.]